MEPEKADGRPEWAPLTVDLDRPSAARVWDYYLGGSHNFQVDRAFAREAMARMPDAPVIARENRAFLGRVVRFLAEQGITQFIDIGSGIPTVGPVHETARATRPGARVVYVDNDPVAVTHSRALLEGDPDTLVVEGDLREPEELLSAEGAGRLIDFNQPVAVLLIAVLHFIPDSDDPIAILERIRKRLARGSYLVIVHASAETDAHHAAADLYQRTPTPFTMRTRDEIQRFFDGFESVPPGLVAPTAWRPDPSTEKSALRTPGFAGVGRLR
ncbi:SAM-dependent methyltransferase [Nocardia sp. CDC160]|uniref:SAM-dependent methyltransferase n=1 Tax=Nocardia sp. CDC160 TaxID=3112166 RepID=UPI002DB85C48|nr:SAM-dependent methyltransferase [Nocardia sp. CDC160]MEC3918364.1 SAM-dependent methyltransferase [Nocardia sp. CDC160]